MIDLLNNLIQKHFLSAPAVETKPVPALTEDDIRDEISCALDDAEFLFERDGIGEYECHGRKGYDHGSWQCLMADFAVEVTCSEDEKFNETLDGEHQVTRTDYNPLADCGDEFEFEVKWTARCKGVRKNNDRAFVLVYEVTQC